MILAHSGFYAHSSPDSRDGYFEMSLDDSVEELVGTSSTSLPIPASDEPDSHEEEESREKQEEEEEEEVQVRRLLWCYCVQVEEEVKQKVACLVLTDQLLGLLCSSHDLTKTNQNTGEQPQRRTCFISISIYSGYFLTVGLQ